MHNTGGWIDRSCGDFMLHSFDGQHRFNVLNEIWKWQLQMILRLLDFVINSEFFSFHSFFFSFVMTKAETKCNRQYYDQRERKEVDR